MSTRKAAAIAASFFVIEATALLVAAYVDDSLTLHNGGVGLLHHPGIFSILVGDVALFALSAKCAELSGKVGSRIPSKNPALVRRYFRMHFLTNRFEGRNQFLQLFIALAIVGSFAVIGQTVKLFDASHHYGHDTFDSVQHPWSFVVNRINLIVSWCFVVPAFVAYTCLHIDAVRNAVRRVRERKQAAFFVQHPDKAGGYAFFGYLNALFVAGAVTILLETLLIYFTHRAIEWSNVLAATLGGGIVLFISIFPMREVSKTLRQMKRSLKASTFARSRGEKQPTMYELFLNHQVRFSPYALSSAAAVNLLRAIAIIPSLYSGWVAFLAP